MFQIRTRFSTLSKWCVFLSLFAAGQVLAGEGGQWGYEGKTGPEHWADLAPDFVLCRHGVNQSPIDIQTTIEAELGPLVLDYRRSAKALTNNGHTLQVDVERGSWLRVEGEEFELLQFHFHTPSEHRYRGDRFPLEAHFVHRKADGELAVVAVMFRLGDQHQELAFLGEAVPRQVGESRPIDLDLAKLAIRSGHQSYFRYTGSLTTPPCSEGVRWFALKQPSHISRRQLDSFLSLIGENARGLQAQNARLVVER